MNAARRVFVLDHNLCSKNYLNYWFPCMIRIALSSLLHHFSHSLFFHLYFSGALTFRRISVEAVILVCLSTWFECAKADHNLFSLYTAVHLYYKCCCQTLKANFKLIFQPNIPLDSSIKLGECFCLIRNQYFGLLTPCPKFQWIAQASSFKDVVEVVCLSGLLDQQIPGITRIQPFAAFTFILVQPKINSRTQKGSERWDSTPQNCFIHFIVVTEQYGGLGLKRWKAALWDIIVQLLGLT